jgi:hypothetical protein
MEQFCWKGVTGTMATLICDIKLSLGRHDSGSRARGPQKRDRRATVAAAPDKKTFVDLPVGWTGRELPARLFFFSMTIPT